MPPQSKPKTKTVRRTETRLESYDPARAESIRHNPPRKLSIAEAACFVGISPRKIRDMVDARQLGATRLGGRIIFDLRRLEADLDKLTDPNL